MPSVMALVEHFFHRCIEQGGWAQHIPIDFDGLFKDAEPGLMRPVSLARKSLSYFDVNAYALWHIRGILSQNTFVEGYHVSLIDQGHSVVLRASK